MCLKNARLSAFFNPQRGGCLYELDLRTIRHNLLATLSRRPEAYHEVILQRVQAGQNQSVIAASNSWLQGEGTPLDYTRVYRGNDNDLCRIALTSGPSLSSSSERIALISGPSLSSISEWIA